MRVYESSGDTIARDSVLATLYARAEFWCMEELRLAQQGDHYEAEGAHRMALRVIRAYEAERENVVPAGLDERPAS